MRQSVSVLAAVFISSLLTLNRASPVTNSNPTEVTSDGEADGGSLKISDGKDDFAPLDADFEYDDSGVLINFLGSDDKDLYSVTHLHRKEGEILIPCFGMWWPVGGGTYYDYGGGDDDGDEDRKRRRSRKQKKAAKMKKKKRS